MAKQIEQNQTENQATENKSKLITRIIISTISSILVAFAALVLIRVNNFSDKKDAPSLSHLQEVQLYTYLQETYPQRYEILHKLSYIDNYPSLDVGAGSAILIDVRTGDILYEKNADEIIPPASMTKLFAMYVVDQEVAAGRLSYNQIIPIPEEALACNMPPHSSLMFLGEGQVVTLEELLLGLSICSGNDAAYALAYTVSGSMEAFIERMNQIAFDLKLKNTHFVESSGYSELNTTTAREMAAFCKVYLSEHPDSLKKFHAVRNFTYPKEENMAPGDKYGPQDFSQGLPRHITMGITQSNTNPLLGKLKGCDGLKTGYIDESGYNLALTAIRNDTRFLSVTMRGPGRSTAEGQAGRIKDGTTLMNYAFGSFADLTHISAVKNYFVKNYGSKEMGFYAVPAYNVEGVCVPYLTGDSIADNMNNVQIEVNVPEKFTEPVKAGEKVGEIKIILGNNVLETVPLIADRTTTKCNGLMGLIDKVAVKFN